MHSIKQGRPLVKVKIIDGVVVKQCPSCGKILPLTAFAQDYSKSDNRTSFCKNCRNTRHKMRRLFGFKYKRYTQEPHKAKAKNLIRQAIDLGLIDRPEFCEVCGNKGMVEGHHRDYSKPYDVVWLCKNCHAFVHSQAYKRRVSKD
ncbi:MAG: hypothetical protein M0R51_17220 [Clostridia bacterium]|jgi:hypothetical protein|nr:hypothetical protein [Clostridia bacterium]